jgi:single-stranded-DNA-specific exonuclease
MNLKWVIKPIPDLEKVQQLQETIKATRVFSSLMIQRGLNKADQVKEYFNPNLNQLHDPFIMRDMDKAVARIEQALEEGQKIMVYGDYDVDGTTSVALVYSFLSSFYDNLMYYIPDRYKEGYGISIQGIDQAKKEGVDLIIALDCGIKANAKIEYANSLKIDFIICDHHMPGEELPLAIAILDPKRIDCNYPYKELSGCGIGFKLCQALNLKNSWGKEVLYNLLDLTALSIASDIVPLTGENRVLAYFGLKLINEKPRKSISRLLELANKEGRIDITALVFFVGPRINAAGRIDQAELSVKLLITEDDDLIESVGQKINALNTTRKEYDQDITEEALQMIRENENYMNAKSTLLYAEHWHKGVIGIVASRMIENFYRPTILLTKSGEMASGSARSVLGFDVYKAIDQCSDLLEQFGGHKYAAGMTMKTKNIDAFRERFEEVVSSSITEEQLTPKIEIDLEVDFDELSKLVYNQMLRFAPFGPQNLTPVFCTKNVVDAGFSKTVGSDKSHLKLNVCIQNNKTVTIDGIGFGLGEHEQKVKTGKPFSIAYTLEINEWKGNKTLQLMVKDLVFD